MKNIDVIFYLIRVNGKYYAEGKYFSCILDGCWYTDLNNVYRDIDRIFAPGISSVELICIPVVRDPVTGQLYQQGEFDTVSIDMEYLNRGEVQTITPEILTYLKLSMWKG